jgi:flagellar biosynthesis protein
MSDDNQRSLAVALQYSHPGVPKVTAMGRGKIAEAILKAAEEHNIPIEENPALAEALAQVDLDTEIPEQLYRAVAEVLGYVLRATGKLKN